MIYLFIYCAGSVMFASAHPVVPKYRRISDYWQDMREMRRHKEQIVR